MHSCFFFFFTNTCDSFLLASSLPRTVIISVCVTSLLIKLLCVLPMTVRVVDGIATVVFALDPCESQYNKCLFGFGSNSFLGA